MIVPKSTSFRDLVDAAKLCWRIEQDYRVRCGRCFGWRPRTDWQNALARPGLRRSGFFLAAIIRKHANVFDN